MARSPAGGLPSSSSFSTLILKFYTKGLLSVAAILLGLIIGYAAAFMMGKVDLSPVGDASLIMTPHFAPFGVEFTGAAILGFCMMVVVSAIETVGDVSAITQSGAGRKITNRELRGAVLADGVGTTIAAMFGSLPNSSFSQNVGLIAMTGIMSRHIVTIGAAFLVLCGLAPKIGALIITIPIEVLGGGVIVMFGMVASAGLSMLSSVHWNQRNMFIFGASLSLALGLQLEPAATAHLPETARIFLTSGVLPAAVISIVLNLILPGRQTEVE